MRKATRYYVGAYTLDLPGRSDIQTAGVSFFAGTWDTSVAAAREGDNTPHDSGFCISLHGCDAQLCTPSGEEIAA